MGLPATFMSKNVWNASIHNVSRLHQFQLFHFFKSSNQTNSPSKYMQVCMVNTCATLAFPAYSTVLKGTPLAKFSFECALDCITHIDKFLVCIWRNSCKAIEMVPRN